MRAAEDRLDWAFAFALVHSLLAFVGLVWALVARAPLPAKAAAIAGTAALSGAFAALAFGLRKRRAWAWWLGIALFGLPVAGLGIPLLLAAGDGLRVGFRAHPGAGAGCLWALPLLLSAVFVLFVLPAYFVWSSRSLLTRKSASLR